jgi:uncharacterized protein
MASDKGAEIKLTKIERLMLSNQLKILEKLYPEEASSYSEQRTAIENGYSLHYPWLMEHLYEEMTVQECSDVIDILDMFSALKRGFDSLNDKAGIEENSVRFRGFDGNNETKQMAYARYFVVDLDRFQELRYGDKYSDFNSHSPSLVRYLSMLEIWKGFPNKHTLGKEQIKQLLGI